MRVWIGKYIAGVGIVHSVLGLVAFRTTFTNLIGDGLVNTVNGQPEREFAFWFVVTGFVLVLLGAVIDRYERGGHSLPGFLGWALGTLALAGVLIMPISGWWLFFIPALALSRQSSHHRSAV